MKHRGEPPYKPYAERVPLGLWSSLWAVAFGHVRLNRIRYRFPEEKTMRNKPCPCGSGKKFKKCHGR